MSSTNNKLTVSNTTSAEEKCVVLNTTNYDQWLFAIRKLLESKGLWRIVDGKLERFVDPATAPVPGI
jgi:hypothetical protein